VSRALAAAGWSVGVAALLKLRRRLELVADAEHELRGPATALGLTCERMRRDSAAHSYAEPLDAQLSRLRKALEDLAAARDGRRAGERRGPHELDSLVSGAAAGWQLDWRAGSVRVVADRGRLAQALGNLLANAAEHGAGPVQVRGRRVPGAVRVEVRNRLPESRPGAHGGGGRGLRIARRAAESAGGRLELGSEGDQIVAALELPVEEPRADAA
jgi:signal transduction histidine kinase